MPAPTSDTLRARYRELLFIIDVKLRTGENTDNEEAEIMETCRLLDERGYEINTDGGDWILKLSPETWQGKDEA
jgi:hypothetical protein